MKILWLRLKFKVCSGEIGHTRQNFEFGNTVRETVKDTMKLYSEMAVGALQVNKLI